MCFYPRSPCGERLPLDEFQDLAPDVSIHALLAESDRHGSGRPDRDKVSIHALLAESDPAVPAPSMFFRGFLSTLSLRRATLFFIGLHLFNSSFYPRSPCGERHTHPITIFVRVVVSIHALLAESDVRSNKPNFSREMFLSTLSLRRATLQA